VVVSLDVVGLAADKISHQVEILEIIGIGKE
jgi:hypothetical protein